MSNMLKTIRKGRKAPPRACIYGPPKVGKSQFGASWCQDVNGVFIPTEDGIDGVDVDRFPRPTTWTDFIAAVEAVATGDHDYKLVVIDTLYGAAELAAQHVCETMFGSDWGPKGFGSYGQGLAATSEEMRRLLPLLDKCRERGMAVLLLAHTGVQSVKNPVDGDYQKFTPDVDRRIWARFAAWCDIIGRAEFEHTILKRDGVGAGKAIGASVRVVHFAGSAAEDAGTRVGFELPAKLPLSYEAFRDALGDSSETTSEVQQLWALLTADEAKATLKWLGVSNLEQASPAKLRQLLNRLRQVAAERAAKEDSNAAA